MAFTIKSRLGRGKSVDSFSACLEVEGEKFDVVVKRPHAEYKENDAFGAALLSWGDAQRVVEHDNVAAVLETGRTDDGPYVIQEMIEGAPLSVVVRLLKKRKRTLTPAIASFVAEQIARGLTHLHSVGIVHGGLDPGEVLISYAGDVKVGDQRLRTLDQQLGRDLVGEKDPYRAPEIDDIAKATKEGDVYSFGLILLEMLIGSPIWTSESMTVTGAVLALKDFTHVGQAQPELTDDLVALLASCLSDEPTMRSGIAPVGEKLKAIIAKHDLRLERSKVGEFVTATVPRPDAGEAPTMMLDPAKAEELAAKQDARIDVLEGQSVAIDPDFEKKALTRAARPPPPPPPTPPPRDAGPVAPSIAKHAVVVPNVAKVAARTASELEQKSQSVVRTIVLALGAVIAIAAAVSMFGPSAREIRLRAGSQPTGARLYVDGESVGVTPFDDKVRVEGSTVKLRFAKDGFEEHEVAIATDADELRYEAPLEASTSTGAE